MLALLEVRNIAAAPGDALGGEAAVLQQGRHLPVHLGVGGHELQVVALQGVRDAAPGEEDAPEEGGAAALLLQEAEIDVQDQVLLRGVAQEVDDVVELFLVRDLEDPLALLPLLRHPVKAQGEGPLKDLGQPLGKARVLRNDADLGGVEGVAVEQNAVGLRPGAAVALHRKAAELALRFVGEGHSAPLSRAEPVRVSSRRCACPAGRRSG